MCKPGSYRVGYHGVIMTLGQQRLPADVSLAVTAAVVLWAWQGNQMLKLYSYEDSSISDCIGYMVCAGPGFHPPK